MSKVGGSTVVFQRPGACAAGFVCGRIRARRSIVARPSGPSSLTHGVSPNPRCPRSVPGVVRIGRREARTVARWGPGRPATGTPKGARPYAAVSRQAPRKGLDHMRRSRDRPPERGSTIFCGLATGTPNGARRYSAVSRQAPRTGLDHILRSRAPSSRNPRTISAGPRTLPPRGALPRFGIGTPYPARRAPARREAHAVLCARAIPPWPGLQPSDGEGDGASRTERTVVGRAAKPEGAARHRRAGGREVLKGCRQISFNSPAAPVTSSVASRGTREAKSRGPSTPLPPLARRELRSG